MSELFDAVDALVASRSPLPPAEERKRLRVAHGLTLDQVATALKVRRATVSGWESMKRPTEPRGPEREAYARMLNQLAELYPAPAQPSVPVPPLPHRLTRPPRQVWCRQCPNLWSRRLLQASSTAPLRQRPRRPPRRRDARRVLPRPRRHRGVRRRGGQPGPMPAIRVSRMARWRSSTSRTDR